MCECQCNTAPVEPPFTPAQVEAAVAGAEYTTTYGTRSYTISLGDNGSASWVELHDRSGDTFDTSIGQVKVIEAEGGEGEGDSAHLVIQTVASGQFFRIDGWYQSYDGLYLDGDLREVQEVTKTVKVYE